MNSDRSAVAPTNRRFSRGPQEDFLKRFSTAKLFGARIVPKPLGLETPRQNSYSLGLNPK